MDDIDSQNSLPLTTVTKFGLETNYAATLCYLPLFFVNLVVPAVWLWQEPKNNYFLRFHSAQAAVIAVTYMGLCLGLGVMSVFFMFIPIIGHLMTGLFGLIGMLSLVAFFITNGFLMYAGFKNRLVKLPVLGAVADRLLIAINDRS